MPSIPLRGHFHNTRNTGLANAYAAVEAGVRVLDASLGGIGGCPFAPAATGNIPTEDLVYMLHRSGYRDGRIARKTIDDEQVATGTTRAARAGDARQGRVSFPATARQA